MLTAHQRGRTRDYLRSAATKTAPIVAVLILWEVGVGVYEVIPPIMAPPPTVLVEAGVELSGNEAFHDHVYVTLYRMAIAGVIASVLGAVVGIAIGWSKPAKLALFPLVSVTYPLPTVAILPLIMIFLGQGDAAWIFITVWGANFAMLFTAMRGVSTIGDLYLDVAKDYGVDSTYHFFKEVLVPGSLPSVFTGLRLALNSALVIVIAIEFIAASEGIGYYLFLTWDTFATDRMYVVVVFVGVLGVLITYGLELLSNYLIPWKKDVTSGQQ